MDDDEHDAFQAALTFVEEYGDDEFYDASLPLPLQERPDEETADSRELDDEPQLLQLEELSSDDNVFSSVSSDGTTIAHASAVASPPPPSLLHHEHRRDETVSSNTKSLGKKKSGSRKNPKFNPNKARDERREEVIYLRKKVSELEAQLRKLEQEQPRITANTQELSSLSFQIHLGRPLVPHHQHHQQLIHAAPSASACHDSAASGVWREVASRQSEQRFKSERENIRLKLVLENQLKIARNLEKILNRKASIREIEKCVETEGVHHIYSPPATVGHTDAEIFEELVAGLDNAYAELGAVFQTNGLAHTEAPYSDAVMRSDGSKRGLRLEISANKVLPFDIHSTGRATWHHFIHAKQRTPSRFYNYEFAKNADITEDTILEDFTLKLHAKNTSAHIRVKQVLRRYVEEDGIVIVLRSVFYPVELAEQPLSGVCFRDTEYIVVKRPKTLPGEYSLLQTCYIYSPVVGNEHPKAGAVTDFMLQATEANISASHQMIENVLLARAMDKDCAYERLGTPRR